jgi:hypothetical protein
MSAPDHANGHVVPRLLPYIQVPHPPLSFKAGLDQERSHLQYATRKHLHQVRHSSDLQLDHYVAVRLVWETVLSQMWQELSHPVVLQACPGLLMLDTPLLTLPVQLSTRSPHPRNSMDSHVKTREEVSKQKICRFIHRLASNRCALSIAGGTPGMRSHLSFAFANGSTRHRGCK